jgi:hypothetical protein
MNAETRLSQLIRKVEITNELTLLLDIVQRYGVKIDRETQFWIAEYNCVYLGGMPTSICASILYSHPEFREYVFTGPDNAFAAVQRWQKDQLAKAAGGK